MKLTPKGVVFSCLFLGLKPHTSSLCKDDMHSITSILSCTQKQSCKKQHMEEPFTFTYKQQGNIYGCVLLLLQLATSSQASNQPYTQSHPQAVQTSKPHTIVHTSSSVNVYAHKPRHSHVRHMSLEIMRADTDIDTQVHAQSESEKCIP